MSIYGVDSKVLGTLDSTRGVVFLRSLLWAEASRASLPRHRVVISLDTTTKDGGIDAKVEDVPPQDSLLLQGDSYFQLKTGRAFKPWDSSALIKELFGQGRKPSKKALKPAIRKCLDRDGRYVLITLGHDLQPIEHSAAREDLRRLLSGVGYKKAKVEVLGQGQLAGLVAHYPAICLDLNNRSELSFQSVASWRHNADMATSLKLGQKQTELVTKIRETIRSSSYKHIRLIGEPGIGKSRLVLEALSAEDLAPTTVYVPHGEEFQQSTLFNELLRADRDFSACLVLDDCDEKDRSSIWNTLKLRPNLKLLTVDHGPDESSDSSMLVLTCPILEEARIEEIIASYVGKRRDLSVWAQWCDGSPRVAHAVGDNLAHNPTDLLKPPSTVPIWERFVAGFQRDISTTAAQNLLVLQHLSLFSKFGFEPPVQDEARFLSEWIRLSDPTLTWSRFQAIVSHYKKRRILQGRHTLFIVPKALHIYLWRGFWDTYGRGFDFQTFFSSVPESLQRWFLRLFVYAHASPVAATVVKEILSLDRGPFRKEAFLRSSSGLKFLNHLAEADPSATLHVLESTIGRWPPGTLKSWREGRQDVVWALEKIAVWEDTFPRVAHLLLKLAAAESDTNSNNSTGLLHSLFHVMAPTQAPGSSRLRTIETLMCSTNVDERKLAVTLSQQWLLTRGRMRIVGAEYQGMRPPISFWTPKTYNELWDFLESGWRLLESKSRAWPLAERAGANGALIKAASDLLYIERLAPLVIDTLFELAKDPATDKAQLTKFLINRLTWHTDKIRPATLSRLRRLEKQVTGRSIVSRIERFILNTSWDEDREANDRRRKLSVRAAKERAKLVTLLRTGTRELRKQLPFLVRTEGQKLYEFGYEVARDRKLSSELEAVVNAQCAALDPLKTQFSGGYLRGAATVNGSAVERVILRLLRSNRTRALGVELVLRGTVTNAIVRELSKLLKRGAVGPRAFSRLGWQAAERKLEKGVVDNAVEALISNKTIEATEAALEITDTYYKDGIDLPEVMTYRVLTSPHAFREGSGSMAGYHWEQVIRHFRKQYPTRDLALLRHILTRTDDLHGLYEGSYPSTVASEIARDHPAEAWAVISKVLEKRTSANYRVVTWLSDTGFEDSPHQGPIRHFAPETILAWVDKAPKKRAGLLASCLPKSLKPEDGGLLVKMFIERYVETDEEMAKHLISHFWVGGWSGPESLYLSRKRDTARLWLLAADSEPVRRWLTRYIEYLTSRIERAEIREERGS